MHTGTAHIYPLSLHDALPISTFGGNPVACAAANAVLDVVDEQFVADVQTKGEKFTAALEKLALVDHVRGSGLLLGVVLKQAVAKQAVAKALEHGLIINAPSDNVVRIAPPLIIADADIDVAIEKITAVFDVVSAEEK